MGEQKRESVLDLIHATALQPATWDGVLRRLATMTGCVAGGLTVERPDKRQGTPLTYFGFDPGHVQKTFDHYLPMNPLFGIEQSMQRGFVVTNGDVVRPDVFRKSEFYNGWARPQGLCSPVTVVIHRTAEAYIPLTLVRADGDGEVTDGGRALLQRLAPHLAHAMDITIRLQAARSDTGSMAAVLDAMPRGALLLDAKRRVIYLNRAADTQIKRPDGTLICRTGELSARDVEGDRQLQNMISAAIGPPSPGRGGKLKLRHASGELALTVELTPLRPSMGNWSALGDELGGAARCLVLISGNDVASVAAQYGLTAAETRVLAAVIVGQGLAAVARDLGVARSTVHSHMDKIFGKTGTHRQAELVRLVNAHPG